MLNPNATDPADLRSRLAVIDAHLHLAAVQQARRAWLEHQRAQIDRQIAELTK